MKKNSILLKLLKTTAETELKKDANRTTCFAVFQPKEPDGLNRYKLQRNDKSSK